MANAFLTLTYEPALEDLGDDYYDRVPAATFPEHILRFRNDRLLPTLGLDPRQVGDDDFIEAFGHFQGVRPFLALRYHGYQFGQYNPQLGDGRGFLYGQVRGVDGVLYDFGTKGSGRTPYSRTADGRLTLKGGVREVLAAELLARLGVTTSRCLSLIETGEPLWRGDEPSPTRSSVMIRMNRSHLRFGTFERLHYLQRPDLITPLLDHAIAVYYPEIDPTGGDRYAEFYAALVQRVATLAAQWMAAGFCHAVLNTDNMSITGESFDYGPYAFIPTYDRTFTAAYFDYSGRYSYGNQPGICRLNLELLQVPLKLVMAVEDLEAGLTQYDQQYFTTYQSLMLKRLGFGGFLGELGTDLLKATIATLAETQAGYSEFFITLTQEFRSDWRRDRTLILKDLNLDTEWEPWATLYHQALNEFAPDQMPTIADQLQAANPKTTLLRPVIESVWDAIAHHDNWQPFTDLVAKIWD
ncbi:YdiU family protein [Spirulina major CS-329]|uniref:protein adenylyltransferase SelO n=1 Tax=Spirulina TaxID=1154 RepID=UPI00232E9972|nr:MULTISPECIES: YdiU family protein [Spirulina]MDB9494942.1 YdiU family protein [Spirulina subsalsa CS-330]MDB9504169.1 YdiU family protein [Spirulina major CS-329]